MHQCSATCVRLCLHACTCLHLHVCVRLHACVCIRASACVHLHLYACICMRASASVHLWHRKIKKSAHIFVQGLRDVLYCVHTHTPLPLLIREAGSFSYQSLPLRTSVHHQVLVLLLHLRLLLLRLRFCGSRLLTKLMAQRTPIVY